MADEVDDEQAVRAALEADRAPVLDLTVPRFVAAVAGLEPEVRRRFVRFGLDEETTTATLADVDRKLGAYGDDIEVDWLLGLVRADVVALGRLQFERRPDDDGHAVHVPEGGGLSEAAVADSFARAARVLGAREFHCRSWLLDPLLGALGPDSGIVRFARRFEVGQVVRDGAADRAVAKFVFRRPPAEVLAHAVPRTRLEHLVLAHLRGGGHWAEPRGRCGPQRG
ncbi:hypothetical protein [Kineococcus rhizosphaerae]|uniref:GNAT-like C-terminal domain-containing protein n=1 Tax=Kineococcus rhizosphaerae TaxID=559628 RepID=A0A2T0RBP2_9ACTN|nr:hypothetical protein [Kineococcus rhizosphaerae]PRY18582.1 hypothetical protein CLV37_101828 [Kineococcus rhizosphaerae]